MATVERLRPLPTTTISLLNALEDPESTSSEIANLIIRDQVLTALVLQAANAVSLGFLEPCSCISDAVTRLGFNQTKIVVMQRTFSSPLARRLYGYRLGAGALWEHSLATARIAKYIAHEVNYPKSDEAYISGLLHDIGKLVLDQYILEDYHQIVAYMQQYKISVWEAEETLLGINHAQVGGLVAVKWNLPGNLVNAIRHHHLPSLSATHQTLGAIVNVANAFTPPDTTSLTGLDGRTVNPVALEILHFDELRLEKLRQRVNLKFNTPALESSLAFS
ncbi:MAG: HDOD domain-containing protein [Anaerolineales bacterium]|nr:HDOD domain-containing protein [Anaerolineales bacterium]